MDCSSRTDLLFVACFAGLAPACTTYGPSLLETPSAVEPMAEAGAARCRRRAVRTPVAPCTTE